MEAMVSEKINVELAYSHADVAAGSTERIGLANALRVHCAIRVESVAQDLVLTLKQHTALSGGTTKDLVRTLPVVVKVDTVDSVTVDANGAAAVTLAELNGVAGYAIVEFLASDLEEGYGYVSIAMASAAARLGSANYNSETIVKPAYEQDLKV